MDLFAARCLILFLIPCTAVAYEPTASKVLQTIKDVQQEHYRLLGSEYRFPIVLEEVVVSYANEGWNSAFVFDSTGTMFTGLAINHDRETLHTGDVIRIEAVGTSKHPYILSEVNYKVIRKNGEIPAPRPTSLSELHGTASTEPHVEVVATVLSTVYTPNYMVLELQENDVRCRVFVGPLRQQRPDRFIRPGHQVRLVGVPSENREFPESIIYVESTESLSVQNDADVPPLETTKEINLDTFDDLKLGDWVSVTGHVTGKVDDDHYTLDTGEVGCLIRSVGGYLSHDGAVMRVHGKVARLAEGLCLDAIQAEMLPGRPSVRLEETKVSELQKADEFRELVVSGVVLSIHTKAKMAQIRLRGEDGSRFTATIPIAEFERRGDLLSTAHSVRVRGTLKPGKPATIGVSRSEDCKVTKSKRSFYVRVMLPLCAFAASLGAVLIAWSVVLRRTVRARTVELENALSRLRDTYEASRAAIAVVDEHGVVIEANSKFKKNVGFHCVAGTKLASLQQKLAIHCEDAAQLRAEFRDVEYAPRSEKIFSVKLNLAPRFLEVHTSPVLSADKHIIARQWAFYDITETKKLESQLVQSQKMEAIGRLTRGVAHDFNNLLMAIRGNLELAKVNESNDKQSAYIQCAEKAAERASRIVGQLVSFSRNSELQRKPGNVNHVIAELCTLLRHSFGSDIEVVLELDETLWLSDFDEAFIGRVVMNLCLNARDALRDAKGTIVVSTTNCEFADRQVVRITVQDNGEGIDESTLNKMYEPFFTTKEQGKGSGLGLATSRGIVEQHGGQINCESRVGEGTCFQIDLPRSRQTQTKRPMIKPMREEEKREVAKSEETSGDISSHLLVIDDEQMIRKMAKTILESAGHNVTLASDGKTALAKLSADESISMALLDLTMPGLSGKETLRLIKEQYPKIRVVLSSGSLMNRSQFDDCPPDAFLTKPYRFEELLRVVRECGATSKSTAA